MNVERAMDVVVNKLVLCDELQAILKPLLEEPIRLADIDPDGCGTRACIFCECEGHFAVYRAPGEKRLWIEHEPTCPVLRKDELQR